MRFPITALFILFSLYTVQAVVISGKVTNTTDGKPIDNVTLFIEGTTFGTLTRADGTYSITFPDMGSYKLVASHLGFELKALTIPPNTQTLTMDIALKTKAYNLSEINVVAKDPNRVENMRLFHNGLFGESEFGKKCVILNPNAIYFKREFKTANTLTLSAFADSAIIIENSSLGYRVKYTLVGFQYSPSTISFLGYQYFIDLYADKKIPKKILEARDKAYRGSSMHFFRSLYNKNLEDEGFQTYYVNIVPNDDGVSYKNSLLRNQIFTRKVNHVLEQTESPIDLYQNLSYVNNDCILDLQEPFEIRYILAREENAYLRNWDYFGALIHPLGRQTTLIRLIDNVLMFYPDGSVNNPTSMTTIGYWSFRKLGEFLPLDYKPEV